MVSHHRKHAPRHLATASHPCSPWFAPPPASPWPPKRLPDLEPLLTFDLLFALTSPHGKAPRAEKLLLSCNRVHAARWPTGLRIPSSSGSSIPGPRPVAHTVAR